MTKQFLTLLAFIFFVIPTVSFSAGVFFESEKSTFAQDEEFLVKVYLDTENVSVNAIEGKVTFPSGLVEVREIRDGNSSINFWIEKPVVTSQGTVTFSGITAGGFSGSGKLLFSLVFRSKSNGSGAIGLNGVQILKNDGLGTKVPVKSTAFNFSVSKSLTASGNNFDIEDFDPPESFMPSIGNDPSLFDGANFVAFSTQDKGSGIDYYEVKEGFWGKYEKSESPHLLKDQTLRKKIYIKVFDKKGNERLVTVSAPNSIKWYQHYIIISIIILLIGLLFSKKIWQRLVQ